MNPAAVALLEEVLSTTARLAIAALGKDRTVEILQAEYAAAEVAFEKAAEAKFGKRPENA